MNRGKSTLLVTIVGLLALVLAGCGQPETTEGSSSAGEQITRPEGWTEETHGNNVDPNYDVVFPQDDVNQIKITINSDDWEAMQANMTELFGAPGTQHPGGFPRGGVPPGAGEPPIPGGLPPGPDNIPRGEDLVPDAGARLGGGWADMASENPSWVPATIEFNGLTWTNVGIRYKGNSSLTGSWRSGSLKLPFKLDFDEFEEEYPEIDNQRFYGFKQLSFSNAFRDSTYMRDAISADILAEAGLVAAETAYYEVIIDYGEGEVNLSLYVVIEVIDDTVIERFFGDDSGNIYEGDGPGTSLAQGTLNQVQDCFLKENNQQEADWSDIEELYNVLHSEDRTSDPEAWRESLESIFDVDTFLEWLAISAIIQHWDTYGSMPHNFYLYHNPDTGLLTWISWDHNLVFGAGGGMGGRDGRDVPGGGVRGKASLGREEVGQNWPLIRYLLDDPVYYERYIEYIEETINGAFNPDEMAEKCQELAELIVPYVAKDTDEAAFESAVHVLIDRVYERFEAATTFLAAGS
jgi:spore coat protein H